ncbi:unnamed protein product [Protopolystoma xenopodis]|uniref:Uncharacterized protein n=1 Tax=Protopolystoma xenopodis TaxID=117903 RepID=A0A3S5CLW3_9PLAT|nr:unnamed protein product [Protopolystoma xenopodis]
MQALFGPVSEANGLSSFMEPDLLQPADTSSEPCYKSTDPSDLSSYADLFAWSTVVPDSQYSAEQASYDAFVLSCSPEVLTIQNSSLPIDIKEITPSWEETRLFHVKPPSLQANSPGPAKQTSRIAIPLDSDTVLKSEFPPRMCMLLNLYVLLVLFSVGFAAITALFFLSKLH